MSEVYSFDLAVSELPAGSGVYCIRCSAVSAKVYVGASGDLRQRFIGHRGSFHGGRHQSAMLQGVWDRTGWQSFSFEVLEYAVGARALRACEQRWIDQFYESHGDLFNVHRFSGYSLANEPDKRFAPLKREIACNDGANGFLEGVIDRVNFAEAKRKDIDAQIRAVMSELAYHGFSSDAVRRMLGGALKA